jgi:hypothetical protein
MRKFGVVNDELNRNTLSNSATKASVSKEEVPVELAEDLEVTKLDEEAVALQEMLDKMEDTTQTPRSMWAEEVELEGMTLNEAAEILDSVITNGMYEESYKMGKLVVRVRTRNTYDADRVIESIQDFKPETNGTLTHLIARMNLAASISKFGEREFNFTPTNDGNRDAIETEFGERYNFLSSIPSQIFFSLTQILEKFDRRVQLACDSRAIENF